MKRLLRVMLLAAAVAGCKEEAEESIDLRVELAGQVTTIDEFGFSINEQEGISVSVIGLSVSSVTDSDGSYFIDKLTTGTYNLQFSKAGFGSYVVPGLQLIGGNEPRYLNINLTRTSSTHVEDLQLDFSSNGNDLELRGKVNHVYPFNTALNGPRVVFFFSDEPNVSGDNYKGSISRIINATSGSSVLILHTLDKNTFPPGTTLYVIAFGVANFDDGYTDILTNTTIYPSLSSTPSNISSVTIP